MTYYNRDNLFNYNPIQRGVLGNVGQQGATGARGDEWEFFSSKNYLPENTGFTNFIGLTGFTGLTTTIGLFNGGVLDNKGRIFCIPTQANYVLIIDTNNDTYDDTTLIIGDGTTTYNNIGKYFGGVLAPNGKIYCVPSGVTNILIIDTIGMTLDDKSLMINFSGTPSNLYTGAVLAPNGKIYCVPYNADNILVIDPETNTASTNIVGLTGLTYLGEKYLGGALAPNGKIYCAPRNYGNILIIDPIGNTYDNKTLSGNTNFGINDDSYYGCVLGGNGKIYGIPFNNKKCIYILDPIGNTLDTNTIRISSNNFITKYVSGVLAPNNKIYCLPLIPWYSNNPETKILVIDVEKNTISYINTNLTKPDGGWSGAVLAPNGSIYGIPNGNRNIIKLKTGLPKYPPWMLDAYYNKL